MTQFGQPPSRFGTGHGLPSPCFPTCSCTHASLLLRTHLRRPITFKQYGSERLPVDVDPLPAQGFNFNNVRVVRVVAILGDRTEGSMVVREMTFGRDSEGVFLFCLPFLVPPLILLRVSFGSRHDMCLKETRLKESGAIHFHAGCSTDRRRARCRSRIKMCTILHVGRSVSRRCSFPVSLLRHLTNRTTQIFQGRQPPP